LKGQGKLKHQPMSQLREIAFKTQAKTSFSLSGCFPQYQHDGSETLGDEFTVQALAGDKESVPAVVRVLVTPVNDEPPHIANNTGLVLWEGSTAVITSTHLGELSQQPPTHV
jgi:hypothetical protein